MPPAGPQDDITGLLVRWSDGDRAALDHLMPLVYSELLRIASQQLRRERAGHTLQSSALVHEAFLRLVDQDRIPWQNRAHFYAIAAQTIRRILVDHARGKNRDKRGNGHIPIELEEALYAAPQQSAQIAALDDALNALEQLDPQQCRVVELRFFGGLTADEIASALGISRATVNRDWATARAWLMRQLSAPAS